MNEKTEQSQNEEEKQGQEEKEEKKETPKKEQKSAMKIYKICKTKKEQLVEKAKLRDGEPRFYMRNNKIYRIQRIKVGGNFKIKESLAQQIKLPRDASIVKRFK